MRSGNRSVAKLRASNRKSRQSPGNSRLAEMSARIDSARNASLVRRPVFNRKLEVVAYEVVIGDGPITDIAVEGAVGDDTRRILVNSAVELDAAIVGAGKPVQLMVSSPVVESQIVRELGPERVMLVLGLGVDASPP